ncbi:MAG: hypothetical protein HF978_08075 [Desulfobacteraceae bacterium]|nr:hypothetical protein [Desulfobacteraceae bacterium]MBC2755486.1 hypothetical protein [Desulfobacteraceae bacterium]
MNRIIWLEDNSSNIIEEIVVCQKYNYTVKICQQPRQLISNLIEYGNEVRLVIIDIMLRGVIGLDDIGITDSDTDRGFRAGWNIIDRVLRPNSVAYLPSSIKSIDRKIPVLIVSTKPIREKDNKIINYFNERYPESPKIIYIEKNQMDDSNEVAIEKFEQYIKNL